MPAISDEHGGRRGLANGFPEAPVRTLGATLMVWCHERKVSIDYILRRARNAGIAHRSGRQGRAESEPTAIVRESNGRAGQTDPAA